MRLLRSRRGWLVLGISSTLLLSAAAASANQVSDATVAVATGGLVATGGGNGPNGDSFSVTFVVPTGITQTLNTGTVDFARPWADISEENQHQNYVCSTVTNPTSWNMGTLIQPGSSYNQSAEPAGEKNPRSGVYFDATCADGSGYQFYRVIWTDMVTGGQAWPVFPTGLGDWNGVHTYNWGSAVQYSGDHGLVTVRDAGLEAANLTICGYRDAHFYCTTGPSYLDGGQIEPKPSLITVAEG